MRTKQVPSWLPTKVTISLADVVETRLIFEKGKFVTDPYDCPLVRAVRRAIADELRLNVWMLEDYIVHLESPEGREFKAGLSNAEGRPGHVQRPRDWSQLPDKALRGERVSGAYSDTPCLRSIDGLGASSLV